MSSGLGLPYSISLLYGSTFWEYSKGSRVNSNYEFIGIKRIKCYLPWKIHLRCNNATQLNWGDTVLCHCFYQGLPNRLQDLIANREQGKPTFFHAMYQLAITFDNRYWEQNHKRDRLCNTEKKAADSHHWEQGKMTQYSASSQSSTLPRSQSSTTLPQTVPSQSSLKPPRTSPSIAKSPSLSAPHVDLSDKLGRDGKLNSNKRKRHINNNLCLYCRSKDHKIDGCPRKQPVRARLTTLEEQETPLSENLSEN